MSEDRSSDNPTIMTREEKQVLRIGLLNCRSILTTDRTMNLDVLREEYDLDAICLKKTLQTDEVRNSEICSFQQIFGQLRRDRKVGTHGDTLIAHETNLRLNQAKEIEINISFLSCSVYFLYDLLSIIITSFIRPRYSKYWVSDTDNKAQYA